MSISDRLLGTLLALTYGLNRAKVGFLRLRVGVILSCFLLAIHSAYVGWRTGFGPEHGAVIVLCLLSTAVLIWADRRHYILFRKQSAVAISETTDLRAEEKLQLRGSGLFQVSDMSRYLVEVPVVFWTTQLAEHIAAGKVRALNILGVGVPSEERGWWYVFIEPKNVVEIIPGYLCFGPGLRLAVRVQCASEEGRQSVYFSCDSPEQRARLLKELETRAQAAHQSAA